MFVDQHVDVHLHVAGRGGQLTFVRAFVSIWSAPQYVVDTEAAWSGGTALPVTPPAPAAGSRDARHLGVNKRLAGLCFGGCVCDCRPS